MLRSVGMLIFVEHGLAPDARTDMTRHGHHSSRRSCGPRETARAPTTELFDGRAAEAVGLHGAMRVLSSLMHALYPVAPSAGLSAPAMPPLEA
jgi:hypothetical protein